MAAATDADWKKTVCVTGANGFIGTWLVGALLDKGYSVRGTYQPGTDTSHLFSLPGAGDTRLSLFEADLLDAAAIHDAVRGSSGVFHVASPCTLADPKDPHLELVLPAVQGTLNVLEASRSSNIQRVVLTSSISSLVPNPSWPHSSPVDESSWTDVDYCKSQQKWYPVSKTLAEKAAWDFAKKHELDVVTIHPSTCLGPLLQPGLNASSAVLVNLLQGSEDTQEYHWLGCVHVRDVANAHVLLFETLSASGRYLCTNGTYQFREFAEIVAKVFPGYPIHRFVEETQPGLMPCKDAAKRLIELGQVFTPIEDTIRDAVTSLKAKAFLEQPKQQ